jgi:hypothetical protein
MKESTDELARIFARGLLRLLKARKSLSGALAEREEIRLSVTDRVNTPNHGESK